MGAPSVRVSTYSRPRTDDRDKSSSLGWLCVSQRQKIAGEVELEGMLGVNQDIERTLVYTRNMMT